MELFITASAGKRHVRFIRKHIAAAHVLLKSTVQELSIALVGDKRMSGLHEQFMDVAGPTDVLTFPLELDRQGKVTSGEVVVCVPEATRRARELGRKLEDEILLYALHGLLHLCGYDDRTPRDFRRMHRAEDMILTQLGFRAAGVSPASPSNPPRARRPRLGNVKRTGR